MGADTYGCKRVKLGKYVTDANQAFIFEGTVYVSTSDPDVYFSADGGVLHNIRKKACPFTDDDYVYPQTYQFTVRTDPKYLHPAT